MNDARNFLTASDKQAVEQAIAEAEKQTSAEIVCAVATESGRYDRAEALCGLVGSLMALGVLHYVFYLMATEGGGWSADAASIGWQCAAVVLGFVAGNVKASYIHWIRRLFTSQSEMDDEVARAAAYVFRSKGLSGTKESGGVLLYLSLYERRLYVLTDEGAQKAAGDGFAEELRDIAQTELRADRRADALAKCVEHAAERLKGKMPRQSDDVDELKNDVVVIHPRP